MNLNHYLRYAFRFCLALSLCMLASCGGWLQSKTGLNGSQLFSIGSRAGIEAAGEWQTIEAKLAGLKADVEAAKARNNIAAKQPVSSVAP